jgi:flagellar hook-associated protein 1 FlgK
MSMGMRAMSANYAALQVTGHNIANANVPGYSRQRVELTTALGQFSGAGYFGKGSDVETITRTHDAFLTREARTVKGLAAKDDARLQQLQRLETVFPPGERGLGYAAQQFLDSFADLASLPFDNSARQVVLARADELAARFSAAGQQIDEQQGLLREDLKNTVAQVNTLTANIAKVNEQIAAVRGLGQPPNDLLDARDQLLSELSEHIAVTTVQADDGTVGVFAGGGQPLVMSNRSQPLVVVNDVADPSRASAAVMDGKVALRLDENTMGGGRIAGLLKVQNDDLVSARNLLGQMAAAIGGAINAQQRLGLTLHEPAGSVPAQDMFGIGPPRALPYSSNLKDINGNSVGQIGLTVTDPAQLQASEYDLRADPAQPGHWQVTRLSDGVVRSVAPGDEIDGFRIDVGNPAPSGSDKFLLQPVSRAAVNMTALLKDPRDVAATSPLTATTGHANTGTAAIDSLVITSDAVNPMHTASISFTNGSGAYSWELRDRVTNALVSSGTGNWTPGQAIPSAPDPEINGFSLQITGVPAAGDTLSVALTTDPAGNNGNALAIAALRDQRIVGVLQQSDGSLIGGATATDAYASAMADVGVRVQGASSIAGISSSLAVQAEQNRSSQSGVNLDEEAAILIQFQQSYQAAAKVLQVAQSLFDTLLSTTGG